MDLALTLYLIGLAGAAVAAYFIFASFAFGAGYQPTPRRIVDRLLRLAELRPTDTLYDLGAGTGSIVFRAARVYRARVIGVEIEPIRLLILRLRRALFAERERVTIRWGNFFRVDFHDASVVAVFLWPGAMERLRTKFEQELPPGARVVSYFHSIQGWTPEYVDRDEKIYLYVRAGKPVQIPAA